MDDKAPVLKIDLPLSPTVKPGSDATSQALYQDASGSVVQIRSEMEKGTATATGFVIRDDRTIITDKHVVDGSSTIDVVDPRSGKVWKAKIKDYDDLNDLAVLEIVGARATNFKPMRLGTNNAALDRVDAVDSSKRSLPTSAQSEDALEFIREADLRTRRATDFVTTPSEGVDLKEFLNRPLMRAGVYFGANDSGRPLCRDGRVIGIADYGFGSWSEGAFTPVEAVSSLVNRTSPKFNFAYSYEAGPWARGIEERPLHEKVALAGVAAAGGNLFYRYSSLSGAASLYGVSSMPADVCDLMRSTNDRDTLKYGLATTGDASMTAGLAVIVGGKLPFTKRYLEKAGPYGKAAVVGGLGLKLGSEFVHNNLELYDVSRTDGSIRAPFDISDLPLTARAREEEEEKKSREDRKKKN